MNSVGSGVAMKKAWVAIINVFIMIAMLTFVVLYSNFENRYTEKRQIEHFENTLITMERRITWRANNASVMCGRAISPART